jgi:DNA-binding HxlR family transcriptional regulator
MPRDTGPSVRDTVVTMLGRTYDGQVCSVARALEVLGERWTLLILRDVMLGRHRFEDFQHSLGVARNVLADRLNRLVEAGVLQRVPYQQRPPRHEYRLTPMGRELAVPIIGLMQWGDRHLATRAGPPRLTRHRGCGGTVQAALVCTACGREATVEELDVVPGPGLAGAPQTAQTAQQIAQQIAQTEQVTG